jgi:hypothetical protein
VRLPSLSRLFQAGADPAQVNRKLPDGAQWLTNAELIARQRKSFFDGTANIPRIAEHMRLPAFRYAALDPYTWPPARK